MRHEGLPIPLEFTWKVALRGYRWIEQAGGRLLCPVAALEDGDWPGLLDHQVRPYRPLEEHTGLFRKFSALKPTEAQVREFANQHGQLGRDSNLTLEMAFGPLLVRGETLESWKKEILDLRLATKLWDLLTRADRGTLAELQAALVQADLLPAGRHKLHIDEADPAKTALSVIQRLTDSRLTEHVAVRILFRAAEPRLQVRLEPTDLLGAIWLQFATVIDRLKTFARCAQCAAPFEISRDPRTGKRTDARFCNSRCRVTHYRERIETARRMNAGGRRENEIAKELGTSIATVRRWIGVSSKRGTK